MWSLGHPASTGGMAVRQQSQTPTSSYQRLEKKQLPTPGNARVSSKQRAEVNLLV